MKKVFPKKWLGQHFLNNDSIAEKIVSSLECSSGNVVEVGPGMGILTKHLIKKPYKLKLIEIDAESVNYLKSNFIGIENKVIEGDFLKLKLLEIFDTEFSIIGNFPYNISSQILFKALENKQEVNEVVGMFQKEVAERIAAKPRGRVYGILSVLVQAFFNVEYLFTVEPEEFNPPPKVKSAVIKLSRKQPYTINCDEKVFFKIVKKAFNQRRKKLRNALGDLKFSDSLDPAIFQKRAEELSIEDYVMLSNKIINEK